MGAQRSYLIPSPPFNELRERTRSLITAAAENVATANLLCQIAREIMGDNADFRDFLLEARMAALSMRERRAERSA